MGRTRGGGASSFGDADAVHRGHASSRRSRQATTRRGRGAGGMAAAAQPASSEVVPFAESRLSRQRGQGKRSGSALLGAGGARCVAVRFSTDAGGLTRRRSPRWRRRRPRQAAGRMAHQTPRRRCRRVPGRRQRPRWWPRCRVASSSPQVEMPTPGRRADRRDEPALHALPRRSRAARQLVLALDLRRHGQGLLPLFLGLLPRHRAARPVKWSLYGDRAIAAARRGEGGEGGQRRPARRQRHLVFGLVERGRRSRRWP